MMKVRSPWQITYTNNDPTITLAWKANKWYRPADPATFNHVIWRICCVLFCFTAAAVPLTCLKPDLTAGYLSSLPKLLVHLIYTGLLVNQPARSSLLCLHSQLTNTIWPQWVPLISHGQGHLSFVMWLYIYCRDTSTVCGVLGLSPGLWCCSQAWQRLLLLYSFTQ